MFELPDGSSVESEFSIGQSVEVLKSYIATECGIPILDQQLYLEADGASLLLLDPMSLSDYPLINIETENLVRVEGEMEMGAKK